MFNHNNHINKFINSECTFRAAVHYLNNLCNKLPNAKFQFSKVFCPEEGWGGAPVKYRMQN